MRAMRLAVCAAGAVLCAVMVYGAIREGWPPAREAVITYASAFVAITIGVVVWELRPRNRTGILLTALPFAFLLNDLNIVFPSSRLAETVGWGASWLAAPLIAHVILAYPSGRLTSRLDRALIAIGYCFAAAYGLLFMLCYDPRAPHDENVWEFPFYETPYTHVAWLDLTGAERAFNRTLFVLAMIFLVLLARKLVRASPMGRRVILPLVFAGSFIAVQFGVQMVLYGEPVNSWTHPTWFWIVGVAPISVPVALAAGLLWGRSARSAVADLVVELERTPPGSVRDALARTLGDPSLEVALWLPERSSYVDATGQRRELPPPGSGRAVTVLGSAEAPVAALVHDPVLLERAALLEAAGAAARLALENERLQAELRAQLVELRASRARIVQAGDEERRRLERNLHDGAQQRLLGLGLALQLARDRLGPAANGTAELLADAEDELRTALDELRELARGIHPAILTDQGLAAAVRSLAERSTVPVTILELPEERLDEPVEAAAYFLVSEALANVAKYSRASSVRVSIARGGGVAVVDIVDDGVGGADPTEGSGLRGLLDRIHALEGKLSVDSPPGHGTRIHAEIPCVS
jgi:signal transduction histidine kinase